MESAPCASVPLIPARRGRCNPLNDKSIRLTNVSPGRKSARVMGRCFRAVDTPLQQKIPAKWSGFSSSSGCFTASHDDHRNRRHNGGRSCGSYNLADRSTGGDSRHGELSPRAGGIHTRNRVSLRSSRGHTLFVRPCMKAHNSTASGQAAGSAQYGLTICFSSSYPSRTTVD